jgi:hypothetical protein
MAFKSDGSSHHNGVKNEDNIIEYLKRSVGAPFFNEFDKVEKKGGTKDKNDCLIHNKDGSKKGVSIKNHKNKGSTFDWFNTTCLSGVATKNEALLSLENFINENKNIHSEKNSPDLSKDDIEKIKDCKKKEFEKKVDLFLDSLTSQEIHSLVCKAVLGSRDQYIIINDVPNKSFVGFEASNMRIIKLIEEAHSPSNFSLEKKSKNKSKPSKSRTIYWGSGAMKEDTHLRLRIVLNNGMSALLAGKRFSANNSSSLCVKIQQENVSNLINCCEDRKEYEYE